MDRALSLQYEDARGTFFLLCFLNATLHAIGTFVSCSSKDFYQLACSVRNQDNTQENKPNNYEFSKDSSRWKINLILTIAYEQYLHNLQLQ